MSDKYLSLLLELLCEKIYPRYPELVRNDSKTADIVYAYLLRVTEFYEANRRINPSKLTLGANETVWTGLYYSELRKLGREALRKHIRHLWVSGKLPARLRFDGVKDD